MAAVPLFWNTNMAALTSCEYALYTSQKTQPRSVASNWDPFRPVSQVARVLFSLCPFQYVRTILSESLALAMDSLKSVFNAIRRKPPLGAPEKKTTAEFSFVFICWKFPVENAGDGNSETQNGGACPKTPLVMAPSGR